jgi:flavin-dependent dehydrogenase
LSTKDSFFDVVVAGGGPAGAIAARTLAIAGQRTLLVEASGYDRYRIGEVMDASGRAILRELELEHVLETARAVECDGVVSAWGTDELALRPAIKSAFGPGVILNRRRFDRALAEEARLAGAAILTETRAHAIAATRDGFSLRLSTGDRRRTVECKGVVDATGRRAALARRLGGRQRVRDRLVGLGRQLSVPEGTFQNLLLLESIAEGYWYTVPIGPRRVIAVLLTDGDRARIERPWRSALHASVHTQSRLEEASERRALKRWDARSLLTIEPAGLPIVVAGDAAMACDPLSADGIVRALRSGWEAIVARAAARQRAFAEYEQERSTTYRVERRWAGSPFWARRALPAPFTITLDPRASVELGDLAAGARAEALLDRAGVRAILRATGGGRSALEVLERARAAHQGLASDEAWVSALELLVRDGAIRLREPQP